MNSTDILRKEAHELMDILRQDPNHVLVSHKSLYNERLAMCVDGDMVQYLQSFKQQVKCLAKALHESESKYSDMKAQCEGNAKQLDGLTMVLDQTTKMLDAAEKQARGNHELLEQATKQLEDERAKSKRLEEMFSRIQSALISTPA